MKILFLGVTGNLFKWMSEYFYSLSNYSEITILSRKELYLFKPNVKVLKLNLEDSFSLKNNYDIVFYAAHILPFDIKINEKNYYEKNLLMLNNFLNAINFTPKKIIYVSTNAINEPIYDKKKYIYAHSKLLCEEKIINFSDKLKTNFLILRLPPLVHSWKDFTYEINKLKYNISILPFSSKNKVVFISNRKTFHNILDSSLKTDEMVNKILNFEFSPQVTISDKLNFLKRKLNSNSIVLFVPIKKTLQLKTDYHIKKYYFNYNINPVNELNALT